jgi:antitoxin ParD1/3/4
VIDREEIVVASDVDLGPQLESYVASLIEKGRYNSKSEVLREGVRLVQEREAWLAALDAGIARGLADSAAGRVKPASEVFDRLEARYKNWDDRDADEARHQRRRGG